MNPTAKNRALFATALGILGLATVGSVVWTSPTADAGHNCTLLKALAGDGIHAAAFGIITPSLPDHYGFGALIPLTITAKAVIHVDDLELDVFSVTDAMSCSGAWTPVCSVSGVDVSCLVLPGEYIIRVGNVDGVGWPHQVDYVLTAGNLCTSSGDQPTTGSILLEADCP